MVSMVTHRESQEARRRAHKLIEKVRKHPKILGHYKFDCRIIGSRKRGCIVKDATGKYDFDFQIVLTKNSPDGDKNPTKIKEDFWRAFTDSKNKGEKVENSTTVVTVRCSKCPEKFDASQEKFSFDFVIINIAEDKRIRRIGNNQYTWVELPSRNSYIYDRFNRLPQSEKANLLQDYILPKIQEEKKKPQDQRRASIEIFYQEVNNDYQRKRLI